MGLRRDDLIAARKRAGHTQASLATALDVDAKSVRRWESGESDPRPRRRHDLAAALKLSTQRLDDCLIGSANGALVSAPSAELPPTIGMAARNRTDCEHKGVLQMTEERARAFSRRL